MKNAYRQPTVGKPHDPGQTKYVEVYGHRGTRSFCPENTLPSYKTALKLGIDWIDVDIGVSSDHVLVASHELWLSPDITSRNGVFWAKSKADFVSQSPNLNEAVQPYLINNLSVAELKRFELGIMNPQSTYSLSFPDQVPIPGTTMPTLQEVVDFAHLVSQKKIHFQIEIKTDPTTSSWTPSPAKFAELLYAFLKKNDLISHVEVQAFDWRCLFEIQKLDKRIKTAYLVDDKLSMLDPNPAIAGLWSGGLLLKNYNNSLPLMIKSLGGACYEPKDSNLTKEEVDESHALGLKVVTWCCPDPTLNIPPFNPQLNKQLIQWGVDGIINDDPGRLNANLAPLGLQIPPCYRSQSDL